MGRLATLRIPKSEPGPEAFLHICEESRQDPGLIILPVRRDRLDRQWLARKFAEGDASMLERRRRSRQESDSVSLSYKFERLW